ncbi:cell division protein SepF [Brevibacterium luteolum]|uniref:cell division protein SepF n=1 Tax=Brevibacterium luteolum TaxID=199591 RepID=UPI00223A9826|nr:cell division protein SepF [Brevibacterium luteolum]MCT1829881.1 cell division protein SepF [Brevibacterium luteolum]
MSALKKIGSYLGFVEDYDEQDLRHQPTEQRRTYKDEYDDYADDGLEAEPEPFEPPAAAVTPIRPSVRPVESAPATAMQRIQTIHPRSYNDAKAIGTAFRDGVPVIMNLSAMDEANSKRLVDFSAGLIFGLRGSIEKVTNNVFLLTPESIEVSTEEAAGDHQASFFNQS